MSPVAMLTASEIGLAALMVIPFILVATVIVVALAVTVAVAVVAIGAWALTRASAAVLGEGHEIWR